MNRPQARAARPSTGVASLAIVVLSALAAVVMAVLMNASG